MYSLRRDSYCLLDVFKVEFQGRWTVRNGKIGVLPYFKGLVALNVSQVLEYAYYIKRKM